MRAFEIVEQGINGQLIMSKLPVPTLKSDEVLIKTSAIGVNRADIFQKQGLYKPPVGVTNIPGLEASGHIVAIGKKVKDFAIKDQVMALLEGGGYSEYISVKASQVIKIPKNINVIEAAALPEAIFTCWFNLFYHAKIKPNEKLLIHGASSGIGTMAIQIAKAFNIEADATTGQDSKMTKLKKLGAGKIINYNQYDFAQELIDNKYDVILDIGGGDSLDKNISLLNNSGRMMIIALLNGSKANINLGKVLLKNLTIKGTTLRSQPTNIKRILCNQIEKNILPKISKGEIKPIIDKIFPFKEANKAHDFMLKNQHIGKIVLRNEE